MRYVVLARQRRRATPLFPVQSRDHSRLLMRDKLQTPPPAACITCVCVCVSVAQMAMRHFVYIFFRVKAVRKRRKGGGRGNELSLVAFGARIAAEGRASGTVGQRAGGGVKQQPLNVCSLTCFLMCFFFYLSRSPR